MQQGQYIVKMVENKKEIEEALKLRYKVFVEEENNEKLMCKQMIEKDDYDDLCDHIIIKNQETEEYIGTCRLLPGDRIIKSKSFYTEDEFSLGRFDKYKEETVELGRVCIDSKYRNGRVIQLLFRDILRYLEEGNYKYVIGCAAAYFSSEKELVDAYSYMNLNGFVNLEYGIKPLEKNKIKETKVINLKSKDKRIFFKLPPLVKLYLNMGAKIAGEPAKDLKFNSTHFLVILNRDNIELNRKKRLMSN